jgi:hypothetical protein
VLDEKDVGKVEAELKKWAPVDVEFIPDFRPYPKTPNNELALQQVLCIQLQSCTAGSFSRRR